MPRYAEPRIIFHWKDTDEGRRALCLLAIWLEQEFAPFDELCANPRLRDLDSCSKLADSVPWLREQCPEVFEKYKAVTGKELTLSVISGRIGNFFVISGRIGNFFRNDCREHPRIHWKLADLFPLVEAEYLAKKQGNK